MHLNDSDGNNIQNIVDEKFDLGFPHVWTTDIRPYVWIDNNRIVYTHYGNNGAIEVFVVDIHTKKSTHLSALPRGLYTNLHSAHDGRHVICGYTNYCTASTIVVIDVEKVTMKPLFRSSMEGKKRGRRGKRGESGGERRGRELKETISNAWIYVILFQSLDFLLHSNQNWLMVNTLTFLLRKVLVVMEYCIFQKT